MDKVFERPSTADFDSIRQVAPFASLSNKGYALLRRGTRVRNVPSRSVLLREGIRPDWLDVVLEGCVELSMKAKNREAVIGIVRRNECFDLSSVLLNLPTQTSARSCAPSRLLSFPAEAMREALKRDPAFARALVKQLAEDVRLEVYANGEMKLHSSVERLVGCLLNYEREQGGSGTLLLPCDKRTLASLLAMSAENLSRAFATLSTTGVVVEGPVITLHDIPALTALLSHDNINQVDQAAKQALT